MNNRQSLALCHSMSALDYNRKYYAEHKDWKKKYNAEYYARHKKYWQDYYKKTRGYSDADADKLTIKRMALRSEDPGRLDKELDDWRQMYDNHMKFMDATQSYHDPEEAKQTAYLLKQITDAAYQAKIERDLYNVWKVMDEAQTAKNAANAKRSAVTGRQTMTVAGTPKKSLGQTIKSWGNSFGSSWQTGAKDVVNKGKSIVNGLRAKLGF